MPPTATWRRSVFEERLSRPFWVEYGHWANVRNGWKADIRIHTRSDVGYWALAQYSLTRGGLIWNLRAMLSPVISPNFGAALFDGAGMRAAGYSQTWRWATDIFPAAARWHSW